MRGQVSTLWSVDWGQGPRWEGPSMSSWCSSLANYINHLGAAELQKKEQLSNPFAALPCPAPCPAVPVLSAFAAATRPSICRPPAGQRDCSRAPKPSG